MRRRTRSNRRARANTKRRNSWHDRKREWFGRRGDLQTDRTAAHWRTLSALHQPYICSGCANPDYQHQFGAGDDGIVCLDARTGQKLWQVRRALHVDSSPLVSNGRLYDAIFPSYSHEDKQIVERLERAYRALGLSYLRDVTTLRSGKKWRPELQRLIERADAFQLFWSHSAARSENVTQEWRTAVQLIEDKKKAETFIRPVYWEQPMPLRRCASCRASTMC